MDSIIITVIIVVGILIAIYRITDESINVNINTTITHKMEGQPPEKLQYDTEKLNEDKKSINVDDVIDSINNLMIGSERNDQAK